MKNKRIIAFLIGLVMLLTSCSQISSITNKDQEKAREEYVQKSAEVKSKENTDLEIENNNGSFIDNGESDDDSQSDVDSKDQTKANNSGTKEIKIKATGDILYHGSLIRYGKTQASNGGYDFTRHYELVKDFLSDADITIGNFEGSSNDNNPPASYPMFNTPSDLFDTLKDVGFDILSTANNHALDSMYPGVETTIEAINSRGIQNVGTQMAPNDRVKYIDKDGIKVAFIAFTTTLNGLDPLLDTEEKKATVNFFDQELMKKDIETAKENKADIIVAYPHWGDEYQSYPNQQQIDLSRKMVELGVDLVIGNHPHVVEPAGWYEAANGNKGYIAYALGNFISNQRLETLDDIRTEHGVVLEIDVVKDFDSGETEVKNVVAHPTMVLRNKQDNGEWLHRTVIASEYMPGGPKANDIKDSESKRAQKAFDMTNDTVNTKVD